MQVNIHEAKTNLSRLLSQVQKGEEIIIAKAGKPIALLTKFTAEIPKRMLGRDAELFEVPDDFDDPLPEDILKSFES
ncbi:MAG TPA: type II toxin-antitoxin system Phd/YefM family antitoxin [Deltaproteobacteria bacterium]|nr:type II toxin-antitoxin system Phd/YefM family antitoxin [Deltaproteobacteria bacterium]